MKKIILLGFALLCLFVSCKKEEEPAPSSTRTVLAYMIAGNNLEEDMKANIRNMLKGLSELRKTSRLVIYWDGNSGSPKISCYTVSADGKVAAEKVQRTYKQQNATDEQVMQTVLTDMIRMNPAESYGLILSAHGTGWVPADKALKGGDRKAVGPDKGKWMEIPAMARAIYKSMSRPFDFILFDACLMSDVQVAYELRNSTRYIIASVAEVLSEGFPYQQMMPYLYSDSEVDYTIAMPATYIQYYQNKANPWGTIATIRCSELEALAAAMKATLNQYTYRLADFKVTDVQHYDRYEVGFVYAISDLKDFVLQLAAPDVPYTLLYQLDRTMTYQGLVESSLLFPIDPVRYSGLSLYIPQADKSRWNDFFKGFEWYEAAGFSLFF